MGFGSFVREKREEKGISLNKFAGLLKISPTYWSRVEREVEKPPKDELIQKVAGLLDQPSDDLFILAGRFPPEMKDDVATAIQAYRRLKKPDDG